MGQKCPQPDNWCNTSQRVMKTSFLWTIDNFSELTENAGQMLESSTFCADSDNKTEWYLWLFPNGNKVDKKQFVGLFLALKGSDLKEVSAHFKLALIDIKRQIFKEFETKHIFKSDKDWGWAEFISRKILEDNKKQLLPNDRLTVYCEVTTSLRNITSGQTTSSLVRNKTLMHDMTALYQNTTECDLDIVVKGHIFSAHKLILKARSPVFAAMFNHQMKENQQNRVVIEDIEREVFAKVLQFIYSDNVVKEGIDSNLMLLSAADKYDLEDLKSICEEYISSQLTVKSVSDVLILADNHSAQELKTKAIVFIKNNFNAVVKTEGWKNIIARLYLSQLF